jgi:hypothetical protein
MGFLGSFQKEMLQKVMLETCRRLSYTETKEENENTDEDCRNPRRY